MIRAVSLVCAVAACLLSGCYYNAELVGLAQEGYPAAQYELGRRMLLGIKGQKKVPELALPWLRLSAEGGDHRAMAAVAACYESGVGVHQSIEQSRQWYIRAAQHGNPHACLSLVRLESKAGNMAAATRWLRPLAEAGSEDAQLMCGKMCMAGLVGENHDELAVRYLRFAAMQGNAEACFLMGCCYANGLGVPRNEALMLGWLVNAAAGGYEEAVDMLNLVPQTSP